MSFSSSSPQESVGLFVRSSVRKLVRLLFIRL